MGNSMFKRGFKAVKEEKERQEKNKENMKKGLWRFFIGKDGEEAELSFLTELPINFNEHTLKTNRNGKEYYDSIPCSGENCHLCANDDRPQFKSAWLVIDHREYSYKDKDNKQQTGKDQIRLFVYGTKIAGQLDRKSQRYGLVGRTYIMERIGKGTSTTYTFENGEDRKFTSKEIEQLLPEVLRKDYDGTMDSLYTIVEEQISMLLKGDEDTDTSNDEGEEDVRDNLVSVDEEEEEEKEVVRPKRENSTKSVKKSVKSLIKARK